MTFSFYILPILILFLICFLGIGYGAINAINLKINGKLAAISQTGVFITNVAGGDSYTRYYGTILNSSIELDKTNEAYITYTITVYNNSNENMKYKDATYADEFYSNENIIFEVNEIDTSTIIGPKETKTFTVTFKYKDGTVVEDNTLKSHINFEFEIISEYNITYYASGGKFLNDLQELSVSISSDNLQSNITNEVPTRLFFDFLGWNDEKNSNVAKYTTGQQIDFSSITELYAVWKSKVTSNTNLLNVDINESNEVSIDVSTENATYERLFFPLENLDTNYMYKISFDYEGSGTYHNYEHGLLGYKVINVTDKNKYVATVNPHSVTPDGFNHFLDGGSDRAFDINQNYSNIFYPNTSTMYLYFEFSDILDHNTSNNIIKNIKIEKISTAIKFSGGNVTLTDANYSGYKFTAKSNSGEYERFGVYLNDLEIGKNYTVSFNFYSSAKFADYTYDYYGYQITENLDRLDSTSGTNSYSWMNMDKVNETKLYSTNFTATQEIMYLVFEYSSATDGNTYNYELSNLKTEELN